MFLLSDDSTTNLISFRRIMVSFKNNSFDWIHFFQSVFHSVKSLFNNKLLIIQKKQFNQQIINYPFKSEFKYSFPIYHLVQSNVDDWSIEESEKWKWNKNQTKWNYQKDEIAVHKEKKLLLHFLLEKNPFRHFCPINSLHYQCIWECRRF